MNYVVGFLLAFFKDEELAFKALVNIADLFTNQLSQNTDANLILNESLLMIWDYALISGWKAIIKLGL